MMLLYDDMMLVYDDMMLAYDATLCLFSAYCFFIKDLSLMGFRNEARLIYSMIIFPWMTQRKEVFSCHRYDSSSTIVIKTLYMASSKFRLWED